MVTFVVVIRVMVAAGVYRGVGFVAHWAWDRTIRQRDEFIVPAVVAFHQRFFLRCSSSCSRATCFFSSSLSRVSRTMSDSVAVFIVMNSLVLRDIPSVDSSS